MAVWTSAIRHKREAQMRKFTKMRVKITLASYMGRVIFIMGVCSLLYYLPSIAGLVGLTSIKIALNQLHDFYGLDFYALVFFVPVVYAAYVVGVYGAIIAALASMLILLPYSLLMVDSGTLLRPTSFAIILSAVGAVVAMLQKSDEQRRRGMGELECLYSIGKAADEAENTDRFLFSVIEIIPRTMGGHGIARVKIAFRDSVYQRGLEQSANKIKEDLVVGGEALGYVELYSTTRGRQYLNRENQFARTLVERIGGALRGIELGQSLKNYYEQLEDMVEKRTSDLEKAHEKLRLLSNTVKSSIDGITLTDMSGNLTFANEAAQRMWGYSLEEFSAMSFARLYSAPEQQLLAEKVIPDSRANAWNGELTAVTKDGRRFPVLVTTSPVRDESGNAVAIVGVHRDVTETKEMRDKLIRSERLAAVGELASGVGHELRNPLNVIRNCVYLINMTLNGNASEEATSALKLLDQQVDVSNRIVTDLLDFTRVRVPSRARVDLNNLVKDSLSWIAVPESIAVMRGLDGNSPQVFVDAEQVSRGFVNIISNAVQAMPGKGELKINTGADGSYAWVSFADTGCGISEENLKKLFEPLFTTKPKGIGLGLAITRRLVEQNEGQISVASQVNKGTTFTVKLPLHQKEVV